MHCLQAMRPSALFKVHVCVCVSRSLSTSVEWLTTTLVICCHITATFQSDVPSERDEHHEYLSYSIYYIVSK